MFETQPEKNLLQKHLPLLNYLFNLEYLQLKAPAYGLEGYGYKMC